MANEVIHPITESIRAKVLARPKAARDTGETYESIAEKSGTVRNHIWDLYKEKQITLNMAFKIWEG
jgi:hypothetical protein